MKLASVVEGNPKAPFSIATTPRCRVRLSSFLWIASLYPWFLPYNAECYARRHQVPFFEFLVWLNLRLNPGLPGHWQTLYPLSQWADKYILFLVSLFNGISTFEGFLIPSSLTVVNYENLIRILHSIHDRSTNIIMDYH